MATARRIITISIHAPAKGATPFEVVLLFLQVISIHAPAKGATLLNQLKSYHSAYFNPRSREGSDVHEDIKKQVAQLFQSTLPRRERHEFTQWQTGESVISIHAPAKGATHTIVVNDEYINYFNPRSREGSDYSININVLLLNEFQSTLPRRERL